MYVRLMKRIGTLMVAIAAFIFIGLGAASATNKVTICHAAGRDGTTQYVTLTIDYHAVYGPGGHFNEDGTPQAGHEDDYLGPCVGDTTTTVVETTVPVSSTTVQDSVPQSSTTVQDTTTTAAPETTTTLVNEPQISADTTTTIFQLIPPIVAEPPVPATRLPRTGSDLGLTILAGGLLLAGASLLLTARRKPTNA